MRGKKGKNDKGGTTVQFLDRKVGHKILAVSDKVVSQMERGIF